jgi:hypothetical protein
VWESVYDLSAVVSSTSNLFSATLSEQHGTSWCGILQSNIYFCTSPMRNTDLLESVGENVDVNFAMKFPSRQTIHNLTYKLRTKGLLIYKKQKHKRRVLTEEKLDDIGARFVHAPRKSLKRPAQETGVSKSSARTATQRTALSTPPVIYEL